MNKTSTAILWAATFALLGCAAPTVEQRGLNLQSIPDAAQLKIASAKPLSLRTETRNQNCDVTTFFQIMSERFPEVQNIVEIHYSEIQHPEKTECSYWGIGVTYEGVASGVSAQIPAAEISETTPAEPIVTEAVVTPVAEIPKAAEVPAAETPSPDSSATKAAPEKPAAPAQDSTATPADPEAAKQAEILKLFLQMQAKSDSTAKPAVQPNAPAGTPAQN